MNIEDLKVYEKLYFASKKMGSARILRNHLNLPDDFPIPLSISHGVDMNHCATAMDVDAIEPIHWSHNINIHERAEKVKPSIKLPHPWLMLKSQNPVKFGSGILVIGPPAGKSNDQALLQCLKASGIKSYDILLKDRGAADESRRFWERSGVKTVTAGKQDSYFYDRLFNLLQLYEFVVGCTLSSALFFAASIGRKCEVVEGYSYAAYETMDYMNVVNFDSPTARKFAQLLKEKDYSGSMLFASELLGSEISMDPHELKRELELAILNVNFPVHFKVACSAVVKKMIVYVSLFVGRTGLINNGIKNIFKRRMIDAVCVIKIDEIDVWLNGIDEKNFCIYKVKYRKNITEPGLAVD